MKFCLVLFYLALSVIYSHDCISASQVSFSEGQRLKQESISKIINETLALNNIKHTSGGNSAENDHRAQKQSSLHKVCDYWDVDDKVRSACCLSKDVRILQNVMIDKNGFAVFHKGVNDTDTKENILNTYFEGGVLPGIDSWNIITAGTIEMFII